MAQVGQPNLPSVPALLILNRFPNALDFSDNKVHTYGRVVLTGSAYVDNGLTMTMVGPIELIGGGPIPTITVDGIPPYANNPFIFGDAYDPSSSVEYWPDPDNQTLRIFSSGVELASGAQTPTTDVFIHLVSNRVPDLPLNALLPMPIVS